MYKNAQLSLVWKPYKNGSLSSIKLRVTFQRENKVYATQSKELLTREEFNNPRLKKTKEAITLAEEDLAAANSICEELGSNFSFIQFKILFDQRVNGKVVATDKTTFDSLLSSYNKKKGCKPNTLESYRTAVNWIKIYNPQLAVQDVTSEILEDLIKFISKKFQRKFQKEISPNTLGMYQRGIKALFNYAIEQGILNENPMKRIKIKHTGRSKRAVRGDEWNQFLRYTPTTDITQFAYDFVKLSFAMCGANMVDILALQNRSISNGQIHFTRTKTERVDTNVGIPLSKEAKNILGKYGVLNPNKPYAYILPYYTAGMNEQQKAHKRSDILKRINKGIRLICEEIGIEKFTTYHIRHTFAANASEYDIHAEQLMILLGHKNLTTTQTYINSITNKLMDRTSEYISSMLE